MSIKFCLVIFLNAKKKKNININNMSSNIFTCIGIYCYLRYSSVFTAILQLDVSHRLISNFIPFKCTCNDNNNK